MEISLATESLGGESFGLDPHVSRGRAGVASGEDQITASPPPQAPQPQVAPPNAYEQGELSLEDAAKQAAVIVKKRIKPSVAKPVTQVPMNKSAKSKPLANQPPWQDDFSEITDTPDGLRTLRCPHATFYTHKIGPFMGVVMADGDEWWWYAGTDEDQGDESLREEAEQRLIECFSTNGSGD